MFAKKNVLAAVIMLFNDEILDEDELSNFYVTIYNFFNKKVMGVAVPITQKFNITYIVLFNWPLEYYKHACRIHRLRRTSKFALHLCWCCSHHCWNSSVPSFPLLSLHSGHSFDIISQSRAFPVTVDSTVMTPKDEEKPLFPQVPSPDTTML